MATSRQRESTGPVDHGGRNDGSQLGRHRPSQRRQLSAGTTTVVLERRSKAWVYCLLLVLVSFIILPASAGAWSRAFKVSPIGNPIGAELDADGMLRVAWENKAEVLPRRGVSLTTHTGQMMPAKISALDSYIDRPVGINPVYEEPVFLRDGQAIRCAITVNHQRTRARVFMLVYSHSGALIKRRLIASQSEDTTSVAQVAPTCQVAAAGERAVVEFTQQTASTNRYQGNRQIYVVRVLPGLKATAPVPILASGEAQQAFIPGYYGGTQTVV